MESGRGNKRDAVSHKFSYAAAKFEMQFINGLRATYRMIKIYFPSKRSFNYFFILKWRKCYIYKIPTYFLFIRFAVWSSLANELENSKRYSKAK